MTIPQWIEAFWLWMGPSDEPQMNGFMFIVGWGAMLWALMPVGIIVLISVIHRNHEASGK